MLLNNSTFNILEQQKLSNSPLQVNLKTFRNCTFAEGSHVLGWLLNYNYSSTTTREGFYVRQEGPITNQDNRWPTRVWNLSNSDAQVGGRTCTGVTLDINVTPQNFPGELTQTLINRVAGSNNPILTRGNFVGNFYQFSFVDTDPNLSFSGGFNQSGPRFVDSKTTYRGVQSWAHYVIFRDPSDPACGGTNLQAQQNAEKTFSFTNLAAQPVSVISNISVPKGVLIAGQE